MTYSTAPIKDFAEGIYDGPHATPKDSDSGRIFLGIGNVTPSGRLDLTNIKFVSEEEFPKWTKRVTPQAGDVVFSYEATLHRYAIIPEGFDGCLGRRMALVRPNTKKILPRYLHYYFLSQKWRSYADERVIIGATVNRLPIKDFPNFEISVPDIGIQEEVVKTLSKYDDLIENNYRRIRLLEDFANFLYKEWFVYLRFPGHEHVALVDDIPEGWSKVKIGQVLTLNYGKALKADDRVEGDFPVYGSSGMVGTNIKSLVAGPGIIVGRKGNVGAIYWSTKDYWPIDTVYFISKEESNLYIYYALQYAQFINTDVAVPGLNRDMAYSRKILIPSDSVLKSFLNEVQPIRTQIEKLEEYNAKLSCARDLLLPRLMNGDITV
ncbi:restriction endonuclease subunit S [uncultured Pseudomonas sp.]|uniref:restriction endonuclease subunit S n=1 Tax=uncultured Pseudomonas sp. TaxID=114707 RepID=UPI002590B063|nr:restriction endonuclease subunit S [uncultured Pseudomonas sp.]